MFGFLKKKNKLKELEDRVIAIEKKLTISKEQEENNKIKSNESTVDVVLKIDKTELGKITIDSINKLQKQARTTLLRI